MRKGVDYSAQARDWNAFAKQLLNNGRTFVGRYLPYDLSRSSPSKDARVLTIKEAEAFASAGIDIFVWWEDSPTHMRTRTERRATEGFDAGVEDAVLASISMEYFGQSAAPIYFTVDVDTTIQAIDPYFQGAMSVVGFDRMAAYGGYRVIKGLFDRNRIKYGCQTEAWSRFLSNGEMSGRGALYWDPRAQLRQWTMTSPGYAGWIGEINCDGLDALADDFGQWQYGQENDMTSEQADRLKKIEESTAKQSYTTAITNALDVKNYPEAQRLNDAFYKRWPYPQSTTGLPVGWEPPK